MWGTLGVIVLFMFCITVIAYTAGYADGRQSDRRRR